MNPLIQLKKSTPLFLIPLSLLLTWFALMPTAQAVGPDTDGSIPGSNNGEGIGVLVNRTTGVWNTGTGFEALNHLTSGNQNTATGLRALFSDVNGGFNTATGVYSLFSNTGGFFNSATGAYSLTNNIDGNYNTANGYSALYYNTEGIANTATGYAALYRNTNGGSNTATGSRALFSNITGSTNTATGQFALFSNITGSGNTANGLSALRNNISGDLNTAVGDQALVIATGDGNIALGAFAGSNVTTANNVIAIGSFGANLSDSCFIGHIRGITTANADAIPVLIDSAGQLGTMSSSRRFKKEIKPMDSASETILALNPVTFHYKSDKTGTSQFGLIAEEVAEVNPDLVVRDENGEIYTVRYEAVNAMLLNEFLKAHRKAEQQEATIAQLKQDFRATVAELNARLKEQDSKIEKVSAQVEVSKLAPQMAVNDQ
jgi:hypothetical protein